MNSPEHLGRESPELHFHNLLNSLVSFKRDLEGISDSTNKRSAQELVNAVYRLLAQDYNKLCGHISHEHSQELAQAFMLPQQNLWGDSGSGSRPKL